MKSFDADAEAIMVADQKDSFVTRQVEEADLSYGGIPGDLHFGMTKLAGARESMYPKGTEIFNRRQITVVSIEECAQIAEKLGVKEILPEWLGANLVLKRFPDLTQLAPGSRILFPSGAGLLCEGVNDPCIHPGKVIQQHYPADNKLAARFVKAAFGLRGIIAIVERPGKANSGDKIKIVTASS